MRYLGIEPKKPRVAVFDFTSCEGCELQLVNKEDTLVDFLKLVDVVEFREATSAKSPDGFDVALVEGAVSRPDEIERLKRVRERAKVLVALGTCAVHGGVAKLKNKFDLAEANREVYGEHAKETMAVQPLKAHVKVDLEIPGCPVSKAEVERIVQHVVLDVPFHFPVYPVCVECKQRFTTCMFERGQLCLGPVTRAGCDAPCPAGGLGCLGCRGAAADPNFAEYRALAARHGYAERDLADRMAFFGAFEGAK